MRSSSFLAITIGLSKILQRIHRFEHTLMFEHIEQGFVDGTLPSTLTLEFPAPIARKNSDKLPQICDTLCKADFEKYRGDKGGNDQVELNRCKKPA